MNKKRICMVVPTLAGGGAERVVSVFASSLADQGKEVFLIIHRHAKITEYRTSELVHRFYLDEHKCSQNKFVARFQRVFAVRRYIVENHIDIVIPFLENCMVHTFLATRGVKVKFISTLRNNPYERKKSEKIKCDFVTAMADANFVQNEMQKNYFSRRIRNKTFVLSNPVDNSFFEKTKQYNTEIKRLVAIGRLMEQKNYSRMLHAFEIVLNKHPDVKLTIYGVGKLEDSILEEINKRNLADRVLLGGRTSEVPKVLNDNDLFVLSSDYEGMPNALMEAMAFGMPCISTDCPTGPKELIGDNRRGRLAEMDDGVSLAREICYFIDNPNDAINKGKAAREYMREHFSVSSISKSFYNYIV